MEAWFGLTNVSLPPEGTGSGHPGTINKNGQYRVATALILSVNLCNRDASIACGLPPFHSAN